jgi:hypothetical protein
VPADPVLKRKNTEIGRYLSTTKEKYSLARKRRIVSPNRKRKDKYSPEGIRRMISANQKRTGECSLDRRGGMISINM